MRKLDDASALLLLPKLMKTFFALTGAVITSSGLVFVLQTRCFSCTMTYWIPGTNIVAAWVYPTSVMIIGFFFILYGFRFGIRGVGLMIMVFGAFDVFDKMASIYIEGLFTGSFATQAGTAADPSDVYFWIQNALMFGGFLLAGFPKFKADRYLLAVILTLGWSLLVYWPYLVEWHGLYAYQVYEVALFIYVYHSTALRAWPSLALKKQSGSLQE